MRARALVLLAILVAPSLTPAPSTLAFSHGDGDPADGGLNTSGSLDDLPAPGIGNGSSRPTAPESANATLYEQTFDRPAPLPARGWRSASLSPGDRFVRASSSANATPTGIGSGAAVTAGLPGPYPRGFHARLISPVFDLSNVPGADHGEVDEDEHRVSRELQRELANRTREERRNASQGQAARIDVDPRRARETQAQAGSSGAGRRAEDALVWPPTADLPHERANASPVFGPEPPLAGAPEAGAQARAPSGSRDASRTRLILEHAFELAPGDGATVEVRVLDEDGPSGWRRLPAVVPATDAASVKPVLAGDAPTTYTGRTADGEPAFTGSSGGRVESVFPLNDVAGERIQVAFHLESRSPVPPRGFGWALDRLEIEGPATLPDRAVEGFEGLPDGSDVATGRSLVPELVVRNWGADPVDNATALVDIRRSNASVDGYPTEVSTGPLEPGEAAHVPLPTELPRGAGPIELTARLADGRPDARTSNDGISVTVHRRDVARVSAELIVDPATALVETGAEQRFTVRVRNAGNVAPTGDIVLEARPIDPGQGTPRGPTREIARTAPGLSAPAHPVTADALPFGPASTTELSWHPTDRGVYRVQARLEGGSLTAPAETTVYVGDDRPAELREPFPPHGARTRAQSPRSVALTDDWSFEGFTIQGNRTVRVPAAPSSPGGLLAGAATDDLGARELGLAASTGRQLDDANDSVAGREVLNLSLPDAARNTSVSAPEETETNRTVNVGNVSYARVYRTSRPVLCAEPETGEAAGSLPARPPPPVLCGDVLGRAEVVELDPIRSAAVRTDNLTVRSDTTQVRLGDAEIRHGGDAGFLFVRVDADVQPGVGLLVSPLVVDLGNGEQVRLPGAQPRPFGSDGRVDCCILGPYSIEGIVRGIQSPDGVRQRAAGTQVLTQRSAQLDLSSLLDGLDPQGKQVAITLEHKGLFDWSNGSGVRGKLKLQRARDDANDPFPIRVNPLERAHDRVDEPLEDPTAEPVRELTLESPTEGFEQVLLRPPKRFLDEGLELNLTLEASEGDLLDPRTCPDGHGRASCPDPPRGPPIGTGLVPSISDLSTASPDCPLLDQRAACRGYPAWFVDDVRVLVRQDSSQPWREVAREPFDARHPPRLGETSRGWRVLEVTDPAPHRFVLSENGHDITGEPGKTRALRWGDPRNPGAVTDDPLWSIARTPSMDLSELTRPHLTFRTRYDFSRAPDARGPAGASIVAYLEPEDGGPARRVLLPPARQDVAPGSAYRGDVQAPAFGNLSQALDIRIPQSATATAFIGRSGHPLGPRQERVEPRWVEVAVDLEPIREHLDDHRVSFEFHALSTGPLSTDGWFVDDLVVRDAGPAYDLGFAGLESPPPDGRVGLREPVPLTFTIRDEGAFRPESARITARILDAGGIPVYPDQGDAVSRVVGRGSLPSGPGATTTVTIPEPWIPELRGVYKLVARIDATPSDGDPSDDRVVLNLSVTEEMGARLFDPGPPTVNTTLVPEDRLGRVGEPLSLSVGVENTGTLPFDATRGLDVVVDIRHGRGASVLDRPVRVGVPELLGRPLGAGARAELDLDSVWTPQASGVYRIVVDQEGRGVRAPALVDTVRVVEDLDPIEQEELVPAGQGWSNATRGDPPSMWTFRPGDEPTAGHLSLTEPLNLAGAMSAHLRLTHRYDFEEGFDGGRLEVRTPNGTWHPLPPTPPPGARDEVRYRGYPDRLAHPTGMDLRNASVVPAFSDDPPGTRTTRFDLADAPNLREKVRFGEANFDPRGRLDDRFAPGRRLDFDEQAPQPKPPDRTDRAFHASSGEPPSTDAGQGPGDRLAFVQRDAIAFEVSLGQGSARDRPGAVRGEDLAVSFTEWRALGLHGNERAPPSDVEAVIESPCGGEDPKRLHPRREPPAAYEDNYRNWTRTRFVFEDAARELSGRSFCVALIHREVHARTPEGYRLGNRSTPAYASDLVSPAGGLAVTDVEVGPVRSGRLDPVRIRDTRAGSWGAWLEEGQRLGPPTIPELDRVQTEGSFEILRERDATRHGVWDRSSVRDGTRTAEPAGPYPDGRVVAPLDLTPAVGPITLSLNATWNLTTLSHDERDRSGGLSLFGVEVSTDGGRTWEAVPPSGPEKLVREAYDEGNLAGARHHPLSPVDDPEANSPLSTGGAILTGDQPTPTTVRFDLSRYRGQPVLVALHASFATVPDARTDDVQVHRAQVDGEIFKSSPVELRFRARTDADGRSRGWDIVDLQGSIVRHGKGIGVRVTEPGPEPMVQSFPELEIEVVNRGSVPVPSQRVGIRIHDPPEIGARVHNANLTVPGLDPRETRRVSVDGGSLNWFLPAGVSPATVELAVPRLEGEALTADNHIRTPVGGDNVAIGSELVPVQTEITPQAVDLDNDDRTVTFRVQAFNPGDEPVLPGRSAVRLIPTLPPGETLPEDPERRERVRPDPIKVLDEVRSSRPVVPPRGTVNLTWRWQPNASLDHDTYRVVFDVRTASGGSDPIRHLAEDELWLGEHPLEERVYYEPFGEDPYRPGRDADDWRCVTQPPCARRDTSRAHSPSTSLAIGLPGEGLAAGSGGRAVVETPPFPVLRHDSARLSVRVLHKLQPGQRAFVEAEPIYRNGTEGPSRIVATLSGTNPGAGEERFTAVEANLTGLLAPDNRTRAIRLRFDAPQPAPNGTPPLRIDDVSVSPYDARLGRPESVPIRDGVRKRVRFDVSNEGTMGDTYRFAFQDERGRNATPPTGWRVNLLEAGTGDRLASTDPNATTEPLELGANATRSLDLVVRTEPTGAKAPLLGPIELPLTMRSTTLPSLERHQALELVADARPRPEVSVAGVEVRGDGDPVGEIRTVEVLVANDGFATAKVPVTVTARPPSDAAQPPRPLETPTEGTQATVTVPPGAVRAARFLFTPRHPGQAQLDVRLDPNGTLVQANRSDDARTVSTTVAPLPFPDLNVRLDTPHETIPLGTSTPVTMSITNHGPKVARNVEVVLRAGAQDLLPDSAPHTIGDLGANQTWTTNVTWEPRIPGSTRLTATATPTGGLDEPVETRTDNADSRLVEVAETAVVLSGRSPAEGPPAASFRLGNGGTGRTSYELAATTPEGWPLSIRVDGQPAARTSLASGDQANVTVRLLPPANATAGPTPVRLTARAEDGTQTNATTQAIVPERHRLDLRLTAAPIDPTDPALTILARNAGNVPETIHLDARRLTGAWTLDGDTAEVAPHTERRVRLALGLEGDRSPRTGPVELAWNTTHANGTLTGTVELLERRSVELSIGGSPTAGASERVRVRVANVGNVPVRGTLSVELPDGFHTDLDRRGMLVPPGATRTLEGRIAAPRDAPERVNTSLRLAGAGVSSTSELTVQRADLAVRALSTPPRSPTEGAKARYTATVVNEGSAPVENASVELYVDGTATRAVPIGRLPAGAEADVDLPWRARGGEHTLVAAATSQAHLLDIHPDNDAHAVTVDVSFGGPAVVSKLREMPTPGTGGLAVLLMALAWITRRRLDP